MVPRPDWRVQPLLEPGASGSEPAVSAMRSNSAEKSILRKRLSSELMTTAILIARILLGLAFLVSGLNGLFHFFPFPKQEGRAAQFMGALGGTGYLVIIFLLQAVGGLLLLVGFHVPLGLLLLGPVVVNLLLFHFFLDPKGLPIAAGLGILSAFLLWAYWTSFASIITS